MNRVIACLAGAFCAALGVASAKMPAPPDPGALKVDAATQGLKQDAVMLNRELLALNEDLLYPDLTRVSVYVGVKVGGFVLNEMAVSIDDGEEVRYRYSDSESRSLLRDGLHRILRGNFRPGPHRVHAEFSGRFVDAKPKDPPIKGSVDSIFEKGLGPVDLVLPITRASRLDRPGLPEVARLESTRTRVARRAVMLESSRASARGYAPGSSEDPRLGMAIFLKNDKRYYTAISELLRIAAQVPDPDLLPREFHEQLAECYLNFGMPERAQAIYSRLARETARDPVEAARARLRLGEFLLERGYLDQATDTLSGLSEGLPKQLRADWQDALSRALLAQGRWADAVEILTEDKGAKDLSAYARYNLGIALLNEGRLDQGRTILDRLGTMRVSDLETLTLRDRANLTLGYHFLRAQQGGTAKPIFGRIRTEGPYANRALLGLGWAELAPRGNIQKHADEPPDQSPFSTFSSLGVLLRPGYYDADPFKRLGLRPFRLDRISKQEDEALRRALVPWVELSSRDPMDPAVEEGLLAIPFALDRLKAHTEALDMYQRAIATLEDARKRMEQAAASIKQGRMVETIVRFDADSEAGWQWRLHNLPDAPETYFLQTMLAENSFQESLKNYRDLRLLSRYFDSWHQRLDAFDHGSPELSQPEIPPELFVARARQSFTPPYVIMNLQLAAAPRLAAPGAYDAPLGFDPQIHLKLAAAWAPRNARGSFEQLAALRSATEAMKPRIAAATAAADRQLQTEALAELKGQQRQIERYLVEARLSVARIYDRELKDRPAAPAAKDKK